MPTRLNLTFSKIYDIIIIEKVSKAGGEVPQCRICHGIIDKEKEREGIDWIMPSRNWYYHVKCYNDWKVSSNRSDEDWVLLIYDLIKRDLKGDYNFFLCESQRKRFIKEHQYTNKGMYFALKYFYEVQGNDWTKSHGSIGIIPYIYKEATEYWVSQEEKAKGLLAEIERQSKARAGRIHRTVSKPKKDKKPLYNLDEIEGD